MLRTLRNLLTAALLTALALAIGWLLSGCRSERPPQPVTAAQGPMEIAAQAQAAEVDRLSDEAGRTVGQAVATAALANGANPEQNAHTEATGEQLAIASGALPPEWVRPDAAWLSARLSDVESEREAARAEAAKAAGAAEELRAVLSRAEAELVRAEARAAQERKQAEAEAVDRVRRAEERAAQAIRDAERAAVEAREKAKARQSMILTGIGTLLILAGGVLGYLGNGRMALVAVILGGGLVGLARALNVVPDWVWSVSVGGVAVVALALMWWGYKTGLWQKPPERVGDYSVGSGEPN